MSGLTQLGACAKCSCAMAIPDELYRAAEKSEKIIFFCAYGHGNHYPQGESKEDKLRRERDLLRQQIAERDDRIRNLGAVAETLNRRASAARGQVTRLKNRAAAGLCPCCNRTFTNMNRHMASQHPNFRAEEVLQ